MAYSNQKNRIPASLLQKSLGRMYITVMRVEKCSEPHFSAISELKIDFSSSLEGEKKICFTTAFYFHKNVMTSKPLPLMGVIGH